MDYQIPSEGGSYRLHPDGRVERTDGGPPRQAKGTAPPPAVAAENTNFVFRWIAAATERIGEMQQRIITLEKRLAEVQQDKGLRYRGVYADDEQYEADDFVTHSGSLWCALQDTRSRPGTDPDAWQLAAQRGRGGA